MNKSVLILFLFFFCFVFNIDSQPHRDFIFPDKFVALRESYKAKEAQKTNGQTINAANIDQNPSSNPPTSTLPPPRLKPSVARPTSRKWSSAPFLTELLNKKKNKFTAISPLGLFNTIGALDALANHPSETAKELDTLIDIRYPSELRRINKSLKWLNSRLQTMNVNLSPYFFDKEQKFTSILDVQMTLKNAGVEVAQDPAMIKASLEKELSNTDLTTLNLEIPASSQVILNVLFFNFRWLYEPTPGDDQSDDLYGKKDLNRVWTPIQIQAPAKYIKEEKYMAYKIELSNTMDPQYQPLIDEVTQKPLPVGKQPTTVTGLITYFLYLEDNDDLSEVLLRNVYDELEQVEYKDATVVFPPFRIKDNIEFTSNEFPNLLRENNPDFSNFSQQNPNFQLKQNLKICGDFNGIRAERGSGSSFGYDIEELKATLHFNKPFWVVIYDKFTNGSPLFIGHVREPLWQGEKC